MKSSSDMMAEAMQPTRRCCCTIFVKGLRRLCPNSDDGSRSVYCEGFDEWKSKAACLSSRVTDLIKVIDWQNPKIGLAEWPARLLP